MVHLSDYKQQVCGKLCLIITIVLSQWQNCLFFHHGYVSAEIAILPTTEYSPATRRQNSDNNAAAAAQACVYDDEGGKSVISVYVSGGESCSLEVSVTESSLLVLEVIEEYVNRTEYLFVENLEEEVNNTCARYLAIDGYLRHCKVAFTAGKIRLHLRGSFEINLRDELRYDETVVQPYTFCPEQTGSDFGSENASDGSVYGVTSECGNARGYAVKVTCSLPSISAIHNLSYAVSSDSYERCDFQCTYECRCSLAHRQIRYCPKSNHAKADTSGLLIIPDDITSLNMSNSYLFDLEKGAFQGMRRIGKLNLSRNVLTVLENDAFKGLSELTELELAHNLLHTIHEDAFNGLGNLQALVLDHNLLTTLHPGTFQGLHNMLGLDLSFNSLNFLDPNFFQDLRHLRLFSIFNNSLTRIESETFVSSKYLQFITLSSNIIETISPRAFSGLGILTLYLYLATNRIESIDKEAFSGLKSISKLDLQENGLRIFPTECIHDLRTLDSLNVSNNHLHHLPELGAFKRITVIDIRNNELSWIDKGTFHGLVNNTMVLVNEPVSCCFIPSNSRCVSSKPPPPYITCGRLLPNVGLEVFMWILGWSALLGNIFVLVWRKQGEFKENQVQTLLITNLAASDLLMGIYMLIISSADIHFGQFFPAQAEYWRSSRVCKFAGMLAVSSSEASVFFVTLISIDRYTRIAFPYTAHQLKYHSARAISIVLWIIAMSIGIVPSIMAYIKPSLYDVSEVCIGLPLVRKQILEPELTSYSTGDIGALGQHNLTREVLLEKGTTPNTYFSITIFLGVNLLCFFIVLFCYVEIFWTVKRTGFTTNRRGRDREIRMAMKMALIVLTDFVCWMPIIITGILVQSGATTIPPTVFAWIVTLILPINSSVNPIMYTIATAAASWSRQKASKDETHPEMQPMNRGAMDMSTVMTRTRANSDINGDAES